MDFLDGIVEKENKFLMEVSECDKRGIPIYIWGSINGGGGQAAKCLQNSGIRFDGFVVSSNFFKKDSTEFCLETLLETIEEKVCIIIAFRGYDKSMLIPYRDKLDSIINRDCFAGIRSVKDNGYFSYEWVFENRDKLQGTYNALQDELSKITFIAYINQKISADYKYMIQVKQEIQYFPDDLMQFSSNEVFIDCGAYDGDSAVSFIQALKRRGIDTYKKIISFEPDKKSYKKLCDRKLKNHICICKGVSDNVGTGRFMSDGTSGNFCENGGADIEIDCIDNIMQGRKATMIKMDIEGSELEALKGARKTILKWIPKLAICIYHKREDLWEIFNYIRDLNPKYKFYIRAYDVTCNELVLYAF